MICGYCQFANSEIEHRCRRCGRRLSEAGSPSINASPSARMAVKSHGANALAIDRLTAGTPKAVENKRPLAPAARIAIDTGATLDALPRTRVMTPAQPTLFGAELQPKIIPFEALPRAADSVQTPQMARVLEPTQPRLPSGKAGNSTAAPKKSSSQAPKRKTPTAPVDDAQATLDFLPPQKLSARVLKTHAESVIFCHQQPASPLHRVTAAVLDSSMIMLGFGVVFGIFEQIGHPSHFQRNGWLLLGAMLGVVAFFYGLLFAMAGSVSPGMRWTSLRLINFDGFAPEGKSRALRLLGCWICVLSGGIGLVWALLDEENLTWHDHISKTFPTLRENTSRVVKQR